MARLTAVLLCIGAITLSGQSSAQVSWGPMPTGSASAPISLATVLSGSLSLPPNSAYVRVTNSTGATLTVVPASLPAEGTTITLIDWGGNAGTYNWTFQGTLNGVVNPTINAVNGGLCTLIYSTHGGWGLSP